ncbi:hypothetical protein BDV96DRAFT_639740 [Lophiotrema nucula]|uniref:DUF7730 domain-containing protein n=1 Tax=Lophiotrema nucula TaxID=690887 RepID=A0A6A5ZXS9_9PLEO|nr:hypothetical protein BDV96DRAFT_639740 [Lophiotrema nucula]
MAASKIAMSNMSIEQVTDILQKTALNEKQSPLLRLPGEIRNKIWKYVTGGHVILVKNIGRPSMPWNAEPPTMLRFRLDSQFPKSDALYVPPGTEPPKLKPAERVSTLFTIGRVCRQIRAETRLIQYKGNIFHFDTIVSFSAFMKSLSLEKRNLITSVAIDPTFVFDMHLSLGFTPPAAEFRVLLPKLISIYINPSLLDMVNKPTDRDKILFAMAILDLGAERDRGLKFVLYDILSSGGPGL